MLSFNIPNIVLMSVLLSGAFSATLPRRELTENDLIIFNADSGKEEIVDKATYFASANRPPVAPPIICNGTTGNGTSTNSTLTPANNTLSSRSSRLSKRCSNENIWTINDPTEFVGWDVPMSAVVHAGPVNSTIAVTEGYQIANSVAVSVTADLKFVEQAIGLALEISYTKTWTSTYAAMYTFPIPAGMYGVVVSNPYTTRRTGALDKGCVGIGERVTFTADSFSSEDFNGLQWVHGPIGICISDKYPVPRCTGDGFLY